MPDKALWKVNPAYQHAIPERYSALRRMYVNCCLEGVGLMPGVMVECQGQPHLYSLSLKPL